MTYPRAHLILAAALTLASTACSRPATVRGDNDPIRPHGITRSRAEIVAFMEAEVMPWATRALEPVVGAGRVRCGTCHGPDAEARGWTMPAVAALPQANVGQLAESLGIEPQARNALHGYVADPAKQRVAAHMVGEVLPGMARLLDRPVYDFSQSLAFNQERNAFGCYHCHMAQSGRD